MGERGRDGEMESRIDEQVVARERFPFTHHHHVLRKEPRRIKKTNHGIQIYRVKRRPGDEKKHTEIEPLIYAWHPVQTS